MFLGRVCGLLPLGAGTILLPDSVMNAIGLRLEETGESLSVRYVSFPKVRLDGSRSSPPFPRHYPHLPFCLGCPTGPVKPDDQLTL